MEGDDDQNQESDRLQTLTLALFNLYWFQSSVLLSLPPPPPPLPPLPPLEDAECATSSPPDIIHQRRRNRHRRSLSDDLFTSPTALEIRPPKLRTIMSGKESTVEDEIPKLDRRWIGKESRQRRCRRRRRESGSSKSLSELEFEELKGFMDLGFTFSDAEADPRLMEIVPGLQRLRAAAASEDVAGARRPYLSEAWEDEDEDVPVRKLEIPIEGGGGIDLKDRLKFWAHTVASTVR